MSLGTHVDQSVGIETVHLTIKQVDVQETISLSLSTQFIMSNYMHQQIVLVSGGNTLAAVSKQSKFP